MLTKPGRAVFSSDSSEDDLWDELMDFVRQRLDGTSCLYGFVPTLHVFESEPLTRSLVVRHNHPTQADSEAYSAKSLLEEDACTMRLMQDEPWFYWKDALDWPGVTEAQRRRFEADDALGLAVGISVRFGFFDGRGVAGIGIAAARSTQDEFSARWESQRPELLDLLHQFDAAMRPRMIANRFALPPREKEILTLLAGGMSAKQISALLGLSTKTVQNTIERVRKRLNAANAVEAVTKALAFRLI